MQGIRPPKLRSNLRKAGSKLGCKITEHPTVKIHDRMWIADRSRAIVVGTSLGGIGNKVSFILPLPNNDLLNFLEYLDEEGLITPIAVS